MNERLTELYRASRPKEALASQDEFKSANVLLGSEVAKFAELIVKECMDIVSKQTTLDTNEDFREGFSHGRKLAWTEIRKHFGVEE